MIAILSPAKRLVEVTPSGALSEPEFEHRAQALAGLLREYPAWQLESVLRVNAELALEAYLAYQRFGESGARSPALLSFRGLQYRQLDAASLTEGQMEYAQDHLRLLSALYGVLRPLDGIASYRLEMISAFRPGGQTLYRYWGDALCRSLFRSGQLVLNLASQEYARAVKPHLRPGDRMVDVDFLTRVRGRYVAQATHAKMGRGCLARFLVVNRAEHPEQLLSFEDAGFRAARERCTAHRLVFVET